MHFFGHFLLGVEDYYGSEPGKEAVRNWKKREYSQVEFALRGVVVFGPNWDPNIREKSEKLKTEHGY